MYGKNARKREKRIFCLCLTLICTVGTVFAGEILSDKISIGFCAEDKSEFLLSVDSPLPMGIENTVFPSEVCESIGDKSSDGSGTAGSYAIVQRNLSGNPKSGELLMINQTDYSPDLYSLLESRLAEAEVRSVFASNGASSSSGSGPLVLIIHTHGTEGYAEEGIMSYPENALPRSSDINENIVAVGKTLCDTLDENGISAIHCEIMHDKDSYNNAYNYSRQTVLEYLEKYPSIEYVFDIHRDALVTSDGSGIIKTSASCGAAQIMFVVGTDMGGAAHPDWQKNLSLACLLQYELNGKYTDIARPINLRSASFNEQYTDGSLLIEIGTCANTLEEAKQAAVILGEIIAESIG